MFADVGPAANVPKHLNIYYLPTSLQPSLYHSNNTAWTWFSRQSFTMCTSRYTGLSNQQEHRAALEAANKQMTHIVREEKKVRR